MVVNVDFGSGIFDSRQKKELAGSITDPKMAKRIQYIFASAEANAEHMRRDGSTSLILNNSIAVQQAAGTSIGQKSSKIGKASNANNHAGQKAKSQYSSTSELFTVTSVFDGDSVINRFQLSTDELVLTSRFVGILPH